jgi:hypothetical protein
MHQRGTPLVERARARTASTASLFTPHRKEGGAWFPLEFHTLKFAITPSEILCRQPMPTPRMACDHPVTFVALLLVARATAAAFQCPGMPRDSRGGRYTPPVRAMSALQRAPPASALEHKLSLRSDAAFDAAIVAASSEPVTSLMQLLRESFALDAARVRAAYYSDDTGNSRVVQNVTCLRPADGIDGARKFDEELLEMPTESGRVCAGGDCSCSCSRVTLERLASEEECSRAVELVTPLMPPEGDNTFNLYLKLSAASGRLETHMLLLRLVERVRRAVALEYGVPEHTLSTRQAFVSRITAKTDQAVYTQLHVDESSTGAFHYSAVLHLSPSEDYEGGNLVFVDSAEGGVASEGKTTLVPDAGVLAMFSSGWENPHHVAPVHAGTRLAMAMFFTTDRATSVPRPFDSTSEASCARALWRHALMPESLEDFLAFMQHWPAFLGSSRLPSAAPLRSGAIPDPDVERLADGSFYNKRLGASNVWEVDVDPLIIDEASDLFYAVGGDDEVTDTDGVGVGVSVSDPPFEDVTEMREPYLDLKTRVGAFFAQRVSWESNIAWVSVDDARAFDTFDSLFRRLKLPELFAGVVPHSKTLRMYSAFFVVRSWCKAHNFHHDYKPPVGTDALTLITPLRDFGETRSFQLSYRADAPNGQDGHLRQPEHPPQQSEVRRYAYSKGKAVVFGSGFEHSTEPGAGLDGEAHAYLCFTFGTDQQERWPQIERTLGTQSRIVAQPDGELRLSGLGTELERAVEEFAVASAEREGASDGVASASRVG